MIVMKFGGSSVANKEQIEKVLGVVKGRLDRNPVVVSSAHKGVTDALIGAGRRAAGGEYDPDPVIEKQTGIMRSLGCPDDLLEPLFDEIRDLLRGISLVRELSPRSLDYVSSFGERMSVRCIANFFSRNGVDAKAYDVWDLGFVTDSSFNRARPLPGWEADFRDAFSKQIPKGVVPIITGFVGKSPTGEITTVGRNGSDLTCTLISAALGAEEAQIWTDTDGVMTADPSVVPAARNIPTMRFDEAAELAFFGSRVLHPSTLLPAMNESIPVRVLNTNRPEHPGTVIKEAPSPNPNAITSIAYKENQSVLTLTSTRMFGAAGFLADIFAVLKQHAVVIDMISTSEVSVSLTSFDHDNLATAAEELEPFGTVTVTRGKTILVVVGQHLVDRPGLGAQILRAIAETGVNVEMMSYGMSSINFTMLIDDDDIARAVPVLHDVLFNGD
jgi:aspartate kinase